jgi:hypothetical protein
MVFYFNFFTSKIFFFFIGEKFISLKQMFFKIFSSRIRYFRSILFFFWDIYFFRYFSNKYKKISPKFCYLISKKLKKIKKKVLTISGNSLNLNKNKKKKFYLKYYFLIHLNIEKILKPYFLMEERKKKNNTKKILFSSVSKIKCLICRKFTERKEIFNFFFTINRKKIKIFQILKNNLISKISENYHRCFFCKKKTFSLQINNLISFPFFFLKYFFHKNKSSNLKKILPSLFFFESIFVKNFSINKVCFSSNSFMSLFYLNSFFKTSFFFKTNSLYNFFFHIIKKPYIYKSQKFFIINTVLKHKKKIITYNKIKKKKKINLKKKNFLKNFLFKKTNKIIKLKFCISIFLNFFIKVLKILNFSF